jgi:hypothetical protein
MSVAAQVIQDVVWADDGTFGEHHPASCAKLAQQLSEGGVLTQGFESAVELELAGGMEAEQSGTELGAEDVADGVDRE